MSSLVPFVQIARPHQDILEGKFTLDVYAADLWRVYKGDAPSEYVDPVIFFQKTHMTHGLNELIKVVEERLEGKGRNSTLQLQTPFGGGKTHSLIALYHKAREWGANVVVLEGTAFDAKDVRLWEEMERQLTGKIEITKGDTSCGKEKLIEILHKNEPVLILMDEVLAYCVKSAGINLGETTLLEQTIVFFQELTQAVASSGRSMLVVTLPSSDMEQYGEKGEEIFQRVSKIFGRMQEIFTPIAEEEISSVIRKRLFQWMDEDKAKIVVNEYVDYLERENLFSKKEDLESYRKKFLNSYPFKPEVIEILYTRWGSYPNFQRTRGVLRLLSQVVYDLKDEKIPFIGLGDFNLKNNRIRRELLEHIGNEYDSVIAHDITLETSGAKKVDTEMGSSYSPYKLGTKVVTCIFMTSFSGKKDSTYKGINIRELKIYTSLPEIQSSVIDDVVNKLREKLFFLSDDGLYFTNEPNLNRMVVITKENITYHEINEEERKIIENSISKDKSISVYIFPQFPRDIPDNKNIKIVITKDTDENKFREFLEKLGETPRVYRNTLIFLYPDESYRVSFQDYIKTKLAYEKIYKDVNIKLDEKRRKEIEKKLENLKEKEYEELRKYYRNLYLPNGKTIPNLGLATIGKNKLDKEILEFLRSERIIFDKITPKYIEERYLKEEVSTKNLLESFYRTPGNPILLNEDVLKNAIIEGVKIGIFYIKREGKIYEEPTFEDDEVLTKERQDVQVKESATPQIKEEEEVYPPKHQRDVEVENPPYGTSLSSSETLVKKYKKIYLSFNIKNKGNFAYIFRVLNELSKNFDDINVHIEISLEKGEIEAKDYEILREGLGQINVEFEKEETE